ncbi:RagB/SusD family nutrient uptake outer membrane protein [Pedobacter heparinus]|uniref:RagB/SusD family nutrient uptake outer membrane protein n=1 Tax=Pedobacter heparinus TaxID=984 RepID=UPI002931F53B|nr:RagB/SusD family nutrient uptake outer membrane protein [Pedobacter heparinus]
MKILNTIKYAALGTLLILSGCTKFLDVDVPDNLVKDKFWQNREQVYSSLMGLYTSLHTCLGNFQAWGDIRSSLYAPGPSTNFSISHSQFMEHDIYTNNGLLSWTNQYKAIGWINAFIKNAPTALKNDVNFSEAELKTMLGEAHGLRALVYFYLVRSFKEVPLVKEPYESDTQNLNTAPSSESDVLDFIEEDLELAIKDAPATFSDTRERYGRITKNAARAIMADVKLWRNDYAACIDLCKTLDGTYANTLVRPQDWYNIFYPGNSSESIFEFQYGLQGPSSPLYNWFAITEGATATYSANFTNIRINSGDLLYPSTMPDKHFSADTIRLKNYSAFTIPSAGSTAEVYKFLGQSPYQRAYRRQNDRVSNYIFYRYREVLFMKAEAYGMLGQYDEAEKVINIIREHCDLPALTPGESGIGTEFFNRLLMEREFELGFEGKEWFAAVRISRRPGYTDVLVEKAATNNALGRPYQVIRARLLNMESWFLPYSRIEVDNNPLLPQKDFYKSK